MSYISNAMGWLLAQLSNLLGNKFAASVFVFTVIVNLLMLPLTLRSQRSTAKQAKLKPKLDALKKKYGNDKQKYSQAMSELYTKEGVSMSGGCLPMIIRLFVMIGVYYAVISPLTYVQRIDADAIEKAKAQTSYVKMVEADSIAWDEAVVTEKMADQAVIDRAALCGSEDLEFYAKLAIVEEAVAMEEDAVVDDSMQDAIRSDLSEYTVTQEIDLVSYLKPSKDHEGHYKTIAEQYTANGGSIEDLDNIDFDLLGIDLTESPDFSWNFSNFEKIWLIPLASFATSMITGIISMRMQKKANPDAPNMAFMMLMMPLFSLYIAFSVPGAVGFYWACSNVVASGLQYLSQALYGPNVVLAREQSGNIVKRAKQEKARIEKVSSASEENNAE